MSVHEDLLNNGENNCSFTEDEVDIMCSKDAYGACGDGLFAVKKIKSSAENRRISGLFVRLVSRKKPCGKLGFLVWKHIYFSV